MNVLGVFDGFTLRHADTLTDVERLDEWINADEDHRGIFTPLDFLAGGFSPGQRSSMAWKARCASVQFLCRYSLRAS